MAAATWLIGNEGGWLATKMVVVGDKGGCGNEEAGDGDEEAGDSDEEAGGSGNKVGGGGEKRLTMLKIIDDLSSVVPGNHPIG
jgi:hypothetical protein